MIQCNRKKADGSLCGQPLFECPHCGNVGCFPESDCSYSLQNDNGECKVCGSITLPRKYLGYANINDNFFAHYSERSH